MKKALLLLSLAFILGACSKKEDPNTPVDISKSLKGTAWSRHRIAGRWMNNPLSDEDPAIKIETTIYFINEITGIRKKDVTIARQGDLTDHETQKWLADSKKYREEKIEFHYSYNTSDQTGKMKVQDEKEIFFTITGGILTVRENKTDSGVDYLLVK